MTVGTAFTFPSEKGMRKLSGVPKVFCNSMSCVLKSLDAELKVTKLVVKRGNFQDTTFVILGNCDWMEKVSERYFGRVIQSESNPLSVPSSAGDIQGKQ